MMRFLIVFTFCIFAMAGEALAERRVAMVVGNATYQNVGALDNPMNDAKAVAGSLENLGFEVLLGIDLDQRGMQNLIREYSKLLIGSDVALFYYAGHGIQVSGQNYLIPIDAELQDETDLNFAAVNFDLILSQMEREPRVKLLFLDACRDNPFKDKLARGMSITRSTAQVNDGLAEINVNSAGGTLIAFATDPGALAMDGTGETHSPFTKALLEHIETPGLEIHSMMIDVRSSVWERTHKRQRPWSNSSLTGKFFFTTDDTPPVIQAVNRQDIAPPVPQVEPKAAPDSEPVTPGPQATAPASPQTNALNAEIELEFWRAASEGNSIDEYLAYMDQFPQGRFTMIAAARIERLKSAERTKGLSPIGSVASTPTAPQQETTLGGGSDGDVAALAPEAAEDAMGMNRQTRRELQHRLKLAGFNPGGADGVLGPNSRTAITGWQAARQLAPTGYINNDQFATLQAETEAAYRQLVAAWAAKRQQTARQQPSTTTRTRQATREEPQREGSHLGKAFRKIGHGVRDIFR